VPPLFRRGGHAVLYNMVFRRNLQSRPARPPKGTALLRVPRPQVFPRQGIGGLVAG
jgi:hypothetical protein